MIPIVCLIAALILLVLAWSLGRSCRFNVEDYTTVPATLVEYSIREKRRIPVVEFELDGKTVRVSCRPVSERTFRHEVGDRLMVRYRREKVMGMDQLTVAANDSSLHAHARMNQMAAIAFCVAGIILAVIAVRFLFLK